LKKLQLKKNIKFFWDQKLQFTYPYASIKNVLVTEEAFSSQKRPSNTSKQELKRKNLLLWVIFAFLDPDPDTDPDPQPCVLHRPLCADSDKIPEGGTSTGTIAGPVRT
jgi:hypothetical protein